MIPDAEPHLLGLDNASDRAKVLPVSRTLSAEGEPVSISRWRPNASERALLAGGRHDVYAYVFADVTALPRMHVRVGPFSGEAITTPQERIWGEVLAERQRQDAQWGPMHDDDHSPVEWRGIRRTYENAANVSDPTHTRAAMIKLIAVAVAQVEAIDRTLR